jgi:hypothetical protein
MDYHKIIENTFFCNNDNNINTIVTSSDNNKNDIGNNVNNADDVNPIISSTNLMLSAAMNIISIPFTSNDNSISNFNERSALRWHLSFECQVIIIIIINITSLSSLHYHHFIIITSLSSLHYHHYYRRQ